MIEVRNAQAQIDFPLVSWWCSSANDVVTLSRDPRGPTIDGDTNEIGRKILDAAEPGKAQGNPIVNGNQESSDSQQSECFCGELLVRYV